MAEQQTDSNINNIYVTTMTKNLLRLQHCHNNWPRNHVVYLYSLGGQHPIVYFTLLYIYVLHFIFIIGLWLNIWNLFQQPQYQL